MLKEVFCDNTVILDIKQNIMQLSYNSDDLNSLFFQMKTAGYEPAITFECGRVTNIRLELNKIFCVIRTQQLTTTSIDGIINVASEDIYNNVNVAMNDFSQRLFKLNHRSSYTRQDIDILDEYRTIANVGILKPPPAHTSLVEIDVSKAYTAAFTQIKEVPVFNEFDAFKPYNQQKIECNNLYIVKYNSFNLFLNKNIIYAMGVS
jgi:hypothetical protein